MRTIIAGSRTGVYIDDVEAAMDSAPFLITTVLCGMAQGADLCGLHVAKARDIDVECYPADWLTYGKLAGFVRNCEMARRAEALVAVWDGKSRGTKHMIATAEDLGLLVHVYRVD